MMFFGTKALYVEEDNEAPAALLKRGLEALKDNSVLAFLADGPYGSRTLKLTLFGRNVLMRTGLIEVARMSGAPVIPAFGRSQPDGIFIKYFPPIDVSVPDGMKQFAHIFASHYEKILLENPSRMPCNSFHQVLFTRRTDPLYSVTDEDGPLHVSRDRKNHT
jgi:lauroyl/myristoyl acyltransferase